MANCRLQETNGSPGAGGRSHRGSGRRSRQGSRHLQSYPKNRCTTMTCRGLWRPPLWLGQCAARCPSAGTSRIVSRASLCNAKDWVCAAVEATRLEPRSRFRNWPSWIASVPMREPRERSHVGRYVKRRGLGQREPRSTKRTPSLVSFCLGAEADAPCVFWDKEAPARFGCTGA